MNTFLAVLTLAALSLNDSLQVRLPADAAPTVDSGSWSQWRGPTRDGQFHGPAWPAELNEERLTRAWQAEGLGPSYSGPIVTPDYVFTTATENKTEEVVTAFDRQTGEVVWRTAWSGAMEVPFFAARNGSWIRSTPAFDGESLFVAGMRDVLTCLDAETGEPRWTVDFVERFETELPSFGFVCSPLVMGDHVFVLAGAALVKLDKATGKTVWRQLEDAGGMDSAFSSPIVATLAGERQLVVQTRSDLCGVSLDSGAQLWSMPIRAKRGMNILTPLLYGDSVFTSAYGGRSQLIDIESGETGFASEKAWEVRGQGYMTSPVLIDGHAYLFLRSNRFTCIDLETGQEKWISPPTGDSYWSLVAQDDRILALSDNGRLYHLAANPEKYEVLSSLDLVEDATWAHLAIAGNQLFVRAQSSLIAYDWK